MRAALAVWFLCCLVLLALYADEVEAAIGVWRTSTAYGHCWLVLPIAAFLAFERRDRLHGLVPAPAPVAGIALLLAVSAVAWLADRLALMEARQLALVATVWVLAYAVLGAGFCRAMAIPLAYLVFLVPFGAFLVPALQQLTARMVDLGLSLLDIPHFVDRIRIEIPEGDFLVAEACAGLRFLIASIAFGALYAATLYRNPGRRLAFLAASVVVPILANGLRALGIVVLGHLRGSAEAGAVDHVVYGYLFFSSVILALCLLGLPFRQDVTPRRAAATPIPRPDAPLPALAGTAIACLALAAIPAGSRLVTPARASPFEIALPAAIPPGCVAHAERLSAHAGAAPALHALRAADPLAPREPHGDIEDLHVATLVTPGGTWRLATLSRPPQAAAGAIALHAGWRPLDLATRLALADPFGSTVLPVVATVACHGPDAIAGATALARQIGPPAAP